VTTNETVVFSTNGEVYVEDWPVPKPGKKELLVETERSLISTGTELAKLHGKFGELPAERPGYCTVGRVIEAGPEAKEAGLPFREGDRIGVWNGHGRYHTVGADDWWLPIPEGPSSAEAAFGAIAQITMNGVRRAEVDWGDAVVVFGLGLLGQFASRLALLAGARPVMAVDLEPNRVEKLPEHPGIVDTVGGDDINMGELIERENHGRLADIVIEATGVSDAIPDQFEVLRKQGRLTVLGSPRDATEFDFYSRCHRPGYEIVGAHITTHPSTETSENPWTMQRNAELYFEYLSENSLEVKSLITREESIEHAPDVYTDLEMDRTEELAVQFVW
jgi:threonine dehydrogenase-like Zn-dependent dehydrogenase